MTKSSEAANSLPAVNEKSSRDGDFQARERFAEPKLLIR